MDGNGWLVIILYYCTNWFTADYLKKCYIDLQEILQFPSLVEEQ